MAISGKGQRGERRERKPWMAKVFQLHFECISQADGMTAREALVSHGKAPLPTLNLMGASIAKAQLLQSGRGMRGRSNRFVPSALILLPFDITTLNLVLSVFIRSLLSTF